MERGASAALKLWDRGENATTASMESLKQLGANALQASASHAKLAEMTRDNSQYITALRKPGLKLASMYERFAAAFRPDRTPGGWCVAGDGANGSSHREAEARKFAEPHARIRECSRMSLDGPDYDGFDVTIKSIVAWADPSVRSRVQHPWLGRSIPDG